MYTGIDFFGFRNDDDPLPGSAYISATPAISGGEEYSLPSRTLTN